MTATAGPTIRPTTSEITAADRWQHFLARVGWQRDQRRVDPGLYALGIPTPDSPVFVTANYRLSMDALRAALAGQDAYILVLNTYGINVWCAAGKGTFGTDEIVRRVEATGLANVVTHRRLILPQLGAPGVAAHEVKRRCGFRVEYGPVRAADLPAYLRDHQATPEMRRVRFTLRDRLVLIPVEAVFAFVPMVVAAVVLLLTGNPLAAAGAVAAILAGVVLFPLLLPWLPTRDFSSKGFALGGVVALAFAAAGWLGRPDLAWWARGGWALAYLLALPPVTAYLALNFTGSTTFTSRTGVRREIYAYIPWMAGLFGAGVFLALALIIVRLIGG
jgi:hypothetical protein